MSERRQNREFLRAVARRRMTYDKVAEAAGVNRSTVIRAAQGKRVIYQTAVRLADAVDSTPEQLGLA